MNNYMDKLTEIVSTFQQYQNVPNVPFLSRFTTTFVTNYLKSIGRHYEENKYGIVVKPIKKVADKPTLLIISHLDHPGIVLKNGHKGIFMGLIGTKALVDEVSTNKIPIKIFNPQGEYVGKGKIIEVDPSFKQKVKIETEVQVPTNSYGQFDIDYFSQDQENIYAYNADDGIAVATMLQVIRDESVTAYNVYYLFTTHEEVHQLSSWYYAKTNYFDLTEKDFIINLECLKIENIDNNISNANYNDGVVLQLSNTGCLFGYKNKGQNDAETLVKQVATTNGVRLQTGVIKDSCDSRPFTQFALTPNIVTLTIPNKHKHDGADDGKVTQEIIKKQDVSDFYKLLMACIETPVEESNPSENITLKLKNNNSITNHTLMLNKALLNGRLEVAYFAALLRQHYYPENKIEELADSVLKVLSYIKYYTTKFLGLYKHLS